MYYLEILEFARKLNAGTILLVLCISAYGHGDIKVSCSKYYVFYWKKCTMWNLICRENKQF